ncbi:dihydrodipicolinate synthase family protein [Pseudoduganella albidiflava]|uniref:Dihydrodipicolinate synthase family protein n=1 Tax=Pseudoduganella albidiflava TaxID=321983 RepID=A0A411X0C0_9BURK|nr:dihydrodipicolinate synthase family protein [Pseudoduganella albidiflava]QBI02394.1 dihydrodipicolinate synthase family protein [Pseudoduganella albidiflava]GGY43167.1 dihydrodipicolinate synthase family protein [Pseudoduganella albidiflava]
MTTPFKGIIAYPVTPFQADGSIDAAMLTRLVDRMIDAGVHAIAPLGSTGESAYLDDDEWRLAAETSIAAVARRVPTVVGISELTTQGAIRRARFAERLGADAVMVLPVSYWKLTEAEIMAHYRAIGDAVGLPIMLYNNPATSGIDMSPEFIARICREVPSVTMVKESTGDLQRMHRLDQLTEGRVPFYNGSNPLAFAALNAGAAGWCTAAPNLNAALPLALYEAITAGDLARARAVFRRQLPLLQFIVKIGLPTSVKAGLRLQGIDAGDPRLPLRRLGAEHEATLAAILAALEE